MVEYNVELVGGEYDGLKFHFRQDPPYEWVLRDVKVGGKKIRRTESVYRQQGVYVKYRLDLDDEFRYEELDDLTHIEGLLPLPLDELREFYPEMLMWFGREVHGVLVVHVPYSLEV